MDASRNEPPLPISTQTVQNIGNTEEKIAIGQIIGMALGLAVATLVILVVLIGLCVCIPKKWNSSKYQISTSARDGRQKGEQ